MTNNEMAGVKERIEKKRELLQKITKAQVKLSSPKILGLSAKFSACGDARSRLQSFIYMKGNGSESGVPEGRRIELGELKNKVERYSQEYTTLKEEKELLTAELESLRSELMSLDCSADISDIAAQKLEIDKAKMAICSLSKAIEEQQTIINENQHPAPKELYKKRQDILAEKAMGKDVAAELLSINEEIAAKEKEMSSAGEFSSVANHTLQGLSRKLNEAKNQIESLKNDNNEMIVFALKTEAAKVELEYRAKAQDLVGIYGRLYALDSGICKLTGNSERSFVDGMVNQFKVPAFGPNEAVIGVIFDAQTCNKSELISEGKAGLGELGFFF